MKRIGKPNNRSRRERELIGRLLLMPERYGAIRWRLHSGLFSDALCSAAFRAIERVVENGNECTLQNVLAVGSWNHHDEMDLLSMTLEPCADADLSAKLLTEMAASDILASAEEKARSSEDVFEKIKILETAAVEAHMLIEHQATETTTASLDRFAAKIQGHRDIGHVPKIPTGFPSVDLMLSGGLEYGDFTVIGGTPNAGKTTFLLHLAYWASRSGHRVGFIECEMPDHYLWLRLHGIDSGIDKSSLNAGTNFSAVTVPFVQRMAELPVNLTTLSERTPEKLKAKLLYYILKERAQLIIVDYLQSFSAGSQEEYTTVNLVSDMLRSMALRYKIHVCSASSLNRLHVTKHEKPGLHSLRGSGQVGHDATNVFIIIGEDDVTKETDHQMRALELHIVKNREGARGVLDISYELPCQRMYERGNPPQEWLVGKQEEILW